MTTMEQESAQLPTQPPRETDKQFRAGWTLSEQNASTAGEVSTTAATLAHQAKGLDALVGKFTYQTA